MYAKAVTYTGDGTHNVVVAKQKHNSNNAINIWSLFSGDEANIEGNKR